MNTLPKLDNLIVRLTMEFSIAVIEYCERLESERKYVLARQFLKAGTSIGANVHEAQNAESKVDFVHKMKIAAKEADETEYWLDLCKYSNAYPEPMALPEKLRTITLIVNKIIGTSKRNKLIGIFS